MVGQSAGELARAQAVLDVHVRGLDGRCACGTRGSCSAYEQASAALAALRVLPQRRPDAARRDLMRRRNRPSGSAGIAVA